MQIIDISQTLFATISVALRGKKTQVEEGMLRHMMLNSVRASRVKFKNEFGEDFVIACDDRGGYWRREVFPYYKANRKAGRDASDIDWPQVFEITNRLLAELDQFFPYRVLRVPGAEADDIIAVLAKKYHSSGVLILSRDHDYSQLHVHDGVKQWDNIGKKMVRERDPVRYLQEHIIRGDAGDGIPSILEKDDALIVPRTTIDGRKVRRPSITVKRMEGWLAGDPKLTMNGEEYRNYVRNRELISFDHIPEKLQQSILDAYDAQEDQIKNRKHLFNYFMEKRLRNLMDNIQDF